MKRIGMILIGLTTLVYLAALPAFAQRGGRGGGVGIGGMGGGIGMGGGMGAGRGGDTGNSGNVGGQQNGRIGRGDNGSTNHPDQASRADAKKSPDQMLQQHPKLESRLASLLPAGTNMQQAASGFKNFGQFVAAVHVSHNLGIPFDQLKARVTAGDSLGKAIHELDPQANAKSEAKKAEEQSKQDLQDETDTDNS
jgi:hypothetical protein